MAFSFRLFLQIPGRWRCQRLAQGHWVTLLNAPETAKTSAVKSVMAQSFTFSALPSSICPYHASMCVPVPGLELKEVGASTDYCTFAMKAEVVNFVGSSIAVAFETLGIETFKGAASESFGKWFGDFQAASDQCALPGFSEGTSSSSTLTSPSRCVTNTR